MSEEKRPTGRPIKQIDWKTVDQCLQAGCSGVQTAGYLGIHHQTLYEAVQREFGMTFTDYSSEKEAKGESMLAMKQFQEAMKGDRGMLIWLGKQRLKQRDYKDLKLDSDKDAIIQIVNYSEKPAQPYRSEATQ